MSRADRPTWITAFLDHSPEHHETGAAFWQAATGYALSASRGSHDEFATLVPPSGDDYLRVQRLGGGPDRIHLDLHVDDPRAAADAATAVGAREVADHSEEGYVVLASPAGLPWCFVPEGPTTVPPPSAHPGGSARVLQVALDVPAARYTAELGFWRHVTGWSQLPSTVDDAFTFLVPPSGGAPLRLLLQRVDDEGAARAHLDWGCSDRAATTAHHEGLGARVLVVRGHWTVMADPVGRVYCLTDQQPDQQA